MKNSKAILLNRSDYGAIEIQNFIPKSTLRGYSFALTLLVLVLLYSIYFIKENVRLVKVIPPTIPIQISHDITKTNFTQTETKIDNYLEKPTSTEISGKFVAVDNKELGLEDIKISDFDKQGTATPNQGEENLYPNKPENNAPKETNSLPIIPDSNDFIVYEKDVAYDLNEIQKLIVYPDLGIRTGIEGTVTLKILIGLEGNVLQVNVLNSTNKYLNESAIEAIYKYKGFSPAKQNNKATLAWISIPIMFKLKH